MVTENNAVLLDNSELPKVERWKFYLNLVKDVRGGGYLPILSYLCNMSGPLRHSDANDQRKTAYLCAGIALRNAR